MDRGVDRAARHQALITTIAAARREAGLTQRQLARRLARAHSFVGKVETGRRQLTVVEFCELAAALGVDPRELLARTLKFRDESDSVSL